MRDLEVKLRIVALKGSCHCCGVWCFLYVRCAIDEHSGHVIETPIYEQNPINMVTEDNNISSSCKNLHFNEREKMLITNVNDSSTNVQCGKCFLYNIVINWSLP